VSTGRLYIGFDLGTHCGVGLLSEDTVYAEVEAFPAPMRFKKFRDYLYEGFDIPASQAKKEDIRVAYEQPHTRGRYATRVLVGMEAMLIDVCEELELPKPLSVHTGTLKKFATGKGNASKAEMMAAASNLAARQITDDNEADAIHVAFWLRNEIEGKP